MLLRTLCNHCQRQPGFKQADLSLNLSLSLIFINILVFADGLITAIGTFEFALSHELATHHIDGQASRYILPAK